MKTPTFTQSFQRREGTPPSPAQAGNRRDGTDPTGIRPADRYRGALFLRRVWRRLQYRPEQPLDEAVAIEWQADPQIAIAAVACALEAVELACSAIVEYGGTPSTASSLPGEDVRQAVHLASRFLQAQAKAHTLGRREPYLSRRQGNRTEGQAVADGEWPDGRATPSREVRNVVDYRPADATAGSFQQFGEGAMRTDPDRDDRDLLQVLVVDDDPDIRRFLVLLLEEEGYAVSAAHDGRDALEQIERRRPDLVLLDLQMPRMSGWELRAELARQELEIPLVFMTAGSHARAEAERYQVAGYLAKPFSIEDLLGTLERVRGLPCRAG